MLQDIPASPEMRRDGLPHRTVAWVGALVPQVAEEVLSIFGHPVKAGGGGGTQHLAGLLRTWQH